MTVAEKAIATRPALDLVFRERQLAAAWSALEAADPECEMTADEAEAFLAGFHVVPGAVPALRDQWAEFILAATAMAGAKQLLADEYHRQAGAITERVNRIKARTAALMDEQGKKELCGNDHVLKLKKGRGRVEVTDIKLIPEEFWTVGRSEDLETLTSMRALLDELMACEAEDVAMVMQKADLLIAGARKKRLQVDKRAIQEARKTALAVPGTDIVVDLDVVIE